MVRITAIITSFNRRSDTLRCLEQLQAIHLAPDMMLSVIVVDDASNDGTPESIAADFPGVLLLAGNGCDYWASSVSRALQTVKQGGNPMPDFIFLLNDDVLLQSGALIHLYESALRNSSHCVVGSAVGIEGSGVEASGKIWSRYGVRYKQLPISTTDQMCDSLPGHMMLFAYSVLDACEFRGEGYTHGFFDTVLCARARRKGIPVVLAPMIMGTVSSSHKYRFDTAKFVENTPHLLHALRWNPKCPPIFETMSYLREIGGLWPVRLVAFYRWHLFTYFRLGICKLGVKISDRQ